MTSVIIIDDDQDSVESLDYLLKLKGIDVIGVGYNGKDAVTLYRKHNPDTVLLDLLMPEYDGHYAVEEISKLDPNAKVIVVSGSLDHRTDEIAKHKIVHSVVTKPFDVDDLIKKILN